MRNSAEASPALGRRTLTEATLAALLVAPLVLLPGAAAPVAPVLTAAYAEKTLAVLLIGAILLYLLRLEPAASQPSLPRWVSLPAVVLVAAVVASALLSPYPVAALQAGLLRVLPLLLALAIARAPHPGLPLAAALMVSSSLLLAAAVIAEAAWGLRVAALELNGPAATLVHRNNLAFHLAVGLPLAAGLAREQRGRARLLLVLAMGLLAAALVLTQSRTAWLAAAVGLALEAALRGLRPARLLAAAGIGAALLLVVPDHSRQQAEQRAIASADLDDEAWTTRLAGYRDAIAHIADRPLLGHGPGAYVVEHLHRDCAARPDHPHSDALTAAYESGVPAALALMALVAAVPLQLLRRRLGGGAACVPAPGLAGALVAWLILGTSNSPLALAPSAAHFWVLWGLGLRELLQPGGTR